MLVYLFRQRPPSPCNLTVTRVTSRSLHCDLYSVQDPLPKVWGWRIQSCKAYFLHYLTLFSLNVSLSSLLHSLCPLEVFTYSVLTVHELMQIHCDFNWCLCTAVCIFSFVCRQNVGGHLRLYGNILAFGQNGKWQNWKSIYSPLDRRTNYCMPIVAIYINYHTSI